MSKSVYFDRYSLLHVIAGGFFGALKVNPAIAISVHVVFEIVEDGLKKIKPIQGMFPDLTPDTMKNHVGDTVAFLVGYVPTYRNKK